MAIRLQDLLEDTLKEEMRRRQAILDRQAFCPVPPNHIYVEPTNKCFLKCAMCTDKALRGDQGYMPMERWRVILDSLAKYHVKAPINLIGRGEPLMNRQLPDFVEYASSKGMSCAIISNGGLLDEAYARKLLKAGIRKIQFSLHAHSRETYKQITGVDLYDKVKANLLGLVELNKEYGSRCYINVMSVESSINRHESAEFVKFWTPRVDRAFVTPLYSIQGDSRMADESLDSIKAKLGGKDFTRHSGCAFPWFFLSYRLDGTINPCPYDFKTNFNVGNADDPDYDLMNVWNSEAMLRFRQSHLDREFSYCRSVDYPCETCEIPSAPDTYKGLDSFTQDFHVVFSREFAAILKNVQAG
ncbi:Coenzyme PQQ synthesis protein E [Fundidesulfovibrio magnetotacticus]|uniref:Coenzyme PQQ synthesis protein E n=1 Tax=Fundidesulfovibrio magnetotacticus TaxID=2730080 RepID=A0A6V8LXR0_9BACT|nr:radical SAM/SPASM domain-containing protein [Fundidesulfovibrio magnetotacticus]GFK94839.1 Coenzyme PQQ synthesis protein E [Fundidesulfovibrio magnetotacticus]